MSIILPATIGFPFLSKIANSIGSPFSSKIVLVSSFFLALYLRCSSRQCLRSSSPCLNSFFMFCFSPSGGELVVPILSTTIL